MKKRLLFAMMAMASAVSGFALENGSFVYTHQGRFQITGENINANSAFTDLTGWTLATAVDGKELKDQFVVNGGGYADGINSVQSTDATAGEGMYYKFVPTSASDTYVVSFKMKGAATETTRIKTVAVATNLVRVKGNSGADFGADSLDYICFNTAEELSEEWQTFNYAIIGDGTPRTYYISFTGMATDIQIADLQIAPAIRFADLRKRDAMLERMNAYKDAYAWDEALLQDEGMTETIASLQAVSDESSQEELDELLATAEEVLAEFLKNHMDDYLAGSDDNYLGNTFASKHGSKQSKYGVWNCIPGGRGHWDANAYPDMGHFQNSNTWNNGAPTTAMGVTTQKELSAGSYVFSIKSAAALREPKKNDWNNDDGMKPAYAIAYIAKVVDGAVTDTIASVVKDLEPVAMTPFYVSAKIAEEGTYEFGVLAYCKEAYQALKLGSVTYVGDASIWGKNDNKYNQKQLGYEADVREQITTGRTQLTTAAENLANADNLWNRAELQACVDTVETKIAAYEQLSQDDIIATYQDYYVKSTSDAENGLMVYEVYQAAVKDIIAANKKFTAVNDTLKSMQTTIDAAEATMKLRIYSAATGKEALQAAIATAKDVQAQMKAAEYSEENAKAIVAANEALNAAIEVFKASIPASAIATLVDIDFSQDAVQDPETQLYSIAGAAGTMEFSNFATEVTDAYPFQQGTWSNGEHLYKNYIRVGNGTGTVVFDPTENGSMGSNILKVNCDFFLQGLSGRFVGFYLDAATDTTDVTVASFYANYYDNKIDATSTLPVALGSLQYGSGSSYANLPPEGAEGVTGNTLPKNSFEVILDFGEGSVYCTTTSAKGVVTTEKQEFNKTIPTKFVLKSNYVNNDRRIWFSNLKIQRIAAGETDPFVGITGVKAAQQADGAIYNLAGQKVSKSYKGIVIINGKKTIQK